MALGIFLFFPFPSAFSVVKDLSDKCGFDDTAKPISLRSARSHPSPLLTHLFTRFADPGSGVVGRDVLGAPHNFFAFPSRPLRLLRSFRRLNTSRAVEERALARAYGVASQPSLRTLRVLRRISRPYQNASRQR